MKPIALLKIIRNRKPSTQFHQHRQPTGQHDTPTQVLPKKTAAAKRGNLSLFESNFERIVIHFKLPPGNIDCDFGKRTIQIIGKVDDEVLIVC
jgi:hypothetical protein